MQIIIPMSGIGKRFIIEAWIIKIHTRKKHPYHGILYIIRSYVSFCGGEDYEYILIFNHTHYCLSIRSHHYLF